MVLEAQQQQVGCAHKTYLLCVMRGTRRSGTGRTSGSLLWWCGLHGARSGGGGDGGGRRRRLLRGWRGDCSLRYKVHHRGMLHRTVVASVGHKRKRLSEVEKVSNRVFVHRSVSEKKGGNAAQA